MFSFLILHISSIYVHGAYVGFFIDLFFELCATVASSVTLIASVSLYFGLCWYANAMVDDLKGQMRTINERILAAKLTDEQNGMGILLAVVGEIRFHHAIIG